MNKLFQVHKLNNLGIARAGDIAEAYDRLVSELENVCPPGRELSIALTKLEESCFFAKKSMASATENGQVVP